MMWLLGIYLRGLYCGLGMGESASNPSGLKLEALP